MNRKKFWISLVCGVVAGLEAMTYPPTQDYAILIGLGVGIAMAWLLH